jgi:hypothetical protein
MHMVPGTSNYFSGCESERHGILYSMTGMRKDAGFLSRWAPGIIHVSCVIGASVNPLLRQPKWPHGARGGHELIVCTDSEDAS